MKPKLKKKTKTQDIVFPHPQIINFDLKQFEEPQEKEVKTQFRHRRLSRSNSKNSYSQNKKSEARSLSLK